MNIEPHTKIDDLQKHQTEQLQKQQKEYKLIGSELKVAGHTMFSYNTITGEIKTAEFIRTAELNFNGNVSLKERINVEKDCIYRQSLNKKNLIKRLKREGVYNH